MSGAEAGQYVTFGLGDEVFAAPKEQYTKDLLVAIPGAGFEFGR